MDIFCQIVSRNNAEPSNRFFYPGGELDFLHDDDECDIQHNRDIWGGSKLCGNGQINPSSFMLR